MISTWMILLFTVSQINGISLSRGKPTGQSSTFSTLFSTYAVDGNYGPDVYTSRCAHTNSFSTWWTVDLGAVFSIDSVEIYNRNSMQSRLDNLHVEGFVEADPYFCDTRGNLCGFNPGPSGDVVSLTCPNNTLARYVRIRGYNKMTLCEVDVFGLPSKDCEDQNQRWNRRPSQRLTNSLVDLGVSPAPGDCLVSCLHRGLCSVFNFNVLDGSCTTTSHPVTDEDLAADSNWNVYYTC